MKNKKVSLIAGLTDVSSTPSLNEDYFTKNVHNKIHIPQYLYVPMECRNALKQNFWGEIFLPSKKWRIFGEIQLEIPQKGLKKITFL